MTTQEAQVAALVRDAFQGVALGNGIGLREAKGLDDYAGKKRLQEYRAMDEKDDWSRLSSEELNRYPTSLSFFDAEGMRFHLPAYLIRDLEGTLNLEVPFHLFYPESLSRFGLLSSSQRMAVREYLLLKAADPDREFDRALIEGALREYWSDSA